jgi:hypothetical protein
VIHEKLLPEMAGVFFIPTLFAFYPLYVYNVEKKSICLTGKFISIGHIIPLTAMRPPVIVPSSNIIISIKVITRILVKGQVKAETNDSYFLNHSPEEKKSSWHRKNKASRS